MAGVIAISVKLRARIVAGAAWRDLADVLLGFGSPGGDVKDLTHLYDRMRRGFEGTAAIVEGLDNTAETEKALVSAGVPAVRFGESLVVVYRLPPFGAPPWRTRAPEVFEAIEDALTAYAAPARTILWGERALPLSARTHVMGIVNVTPDSFSDGGRYYDPPAAIRHGLQLVEEGADILDIGGESTRPGADEVTTKEELSRVLPVIEGLAANGVPISIDTMKAEVARAALDAGASIVNDVSAGRADPDMFPLVAERRVPLVLMHMRGDPRTMQKDPTYKDVVGDVFRFLAGRADAACNAGVSENHIIIDPGFGFGKTREHNLVLLRRLREFTSLGYPVLAGTSRKSFIGLTLDLPVEERLEGTAATVAMAVANGAAIIRVHDVAAMRRVAGMVEAVIRASSAG
jgi:dihydropteroate synthase